MELERKDGLFLAGRPVGHFLLFRLWDHHLDRASLVAFLAAPGCAFSLHWDLSRGHAPFSLSSRSLQLRFLGDSGQSEKEGKG
jgi:hypothetical protein